MKILVSGATATLRELDDPLFGALFVPSNGNNPKVMPDVWGIDNGAFSHFDAENFVRLLARFHGRPGCRFVVAPDVVGHADKTWKKFQVWAPVIRAFGYPVALAAQDGLTVQNAPWGHFDALFIGGTTKYKLSATVRDLVAYAKARGLWVHMGRVSQETRLDYAEQIGCDSVDASKFSKWSKVWLPVAQEWHRTRHQRRKANPKLWDVA